MAYVNQSENALQTLTGQNQDRVTPNVIPIYSDEPDQATLALAEQKYQEQVAAFQDQIRAKAARLSEVGVLSKEGAQLKAELEAMNRPENQPQKPDAGALQAQSDRRRLFALAAGAYQPVINDLLASSRGQGPSAALNVYQQAADNSTRRIMGDAASLRATGGQRAAMYRDAMGQSSDARMEAAKQAAIIGANEQNQARGALNQTLSGLSNLYGNYLYQGTQNAQQFNAGEQDKADQINYGIQTNNATNATNSARSGVQAVGSAARGGV